MENVEKMESFGEVDTTEVNNSDSVEELDDLSIFKKLLAERKAETGVYYYYPDEKIEYGHSVIINAKRELKIEYLLEVKEGPVTFISVMKTIDIEQLQAEDENAQLLKETNSYLGKGLYFFITSESNMQRLYKQCLPSEDKSYKVTGKEFKGKEILYHNYSGEFLYDPFNDIAFVNKELLQANKVSLGKEPIEFVYKECLESIVDINEVQRTL